MKNRIVLIIISYYLLFTTNTPGLLLCFGNNGHVAIEFTDETCEEGIHNSIEFIDCNNINCDVFCLDFPLGGESPEEFIQSPQFSPDKVFHLNPCLIPANSNSFSKFNEQLIWSNIASSLSSNPQISICKTVRLLI